MTEGTELNPLPLDAKVIELTCPEESISAIPEASIPQLSEGESIVTVGALVYPVPQLPTFIFNTSLYKSSI